ncbi:MAG: T9SS type A sorting domain-containing protein, partial [Bacteroidota bacterium]
NDDNRVNDFTTGEQYEGSYIELTDVTVVEVLPFSNGSRVSFNVADGDGNLMNISDRFTVQRLPGNGGNFVAPPVGTVYDTLRGVIAHSANGCVQGNGRGYEMYPYREEDYVIGFSAPLISNVSRNPVTPMATEDVTVNATIADPDGNVVSASLFYAVGLGNNNFLELPMSANGSTYSATIPNTSYSDGDYVKFYLSATDDSAATSTNPVDGPVEPYFFAVRDDGTTIRDVQFTPFENGDSPYQGLEVEVTGIVTASSQPGDANTPGDLGFVYIQQPGENTWGGLSLTGNAELSDLRRGDEVRVRGTIRESFGLTQMADIVSVDTLSSGNVIAPVEVNADSFSDYDFVRTEPYECMLVTLVDPAGDGVAVVDDNADDGGGSTSNFAEYRVGNNILNGPDVGCRVLAGRRTNSAFGSLDFSYVNDSLWITDFGEMNVEACIVSVGDTMTSLSGIMYYSFGEMKLLPRNNLDAPGYNGANCAGGIVPVDIEEELAGSEFTVFPNPSNAAFTLRYTFPEFVEAQVEVRDMMGRQIARKEIRGVTGEVSLDGRAWASGTYFMVVRTRGEVLATQKILLTK